MAATIMSAETILSTAKAEKQAAGQEPKMEHRRSGIVHIRRPHPREE